MISAGVIREKAHEALTDLRGVLGVLRGEDGEPAPRPRSRRTPTSSKTIAEARESGLAIDYHDRVHRAAGRCRTRPDGRSTASCRKGITNARKHAPNTLLTIELKRLPGSTAWT